MRKKHKARAREEEKRHQRRIPTAPRVSKHVDCHPRRKSAPCAGGGFFLKGICNACGHHFACHNKVVDA